MYELLTGQLPYRASDKELYMKMAISTGIRPKPPSRINSAIPQKLNQIILRALEKEPSARYHSVAQLMLDLDRLPSIFKQPSTFANQRSAFICIGPAVLETKESEPNTEASQFIAISDPGKPSPVENECQMEKIKDSRLQPIFT